MAAESPMEKHLLEASCSICWEFFKDPIILDCEHIFCQDCIMKCWKPSLTKLACPQCKEMVSQEGFSPSQQLDNAIRLRKQLRDQAGGETKCCQQHQARLELFCKNDQVFVCSVCRGSEEHQAHTVIPVEKAALEFKELFCCCLNVLKKERNEILKFQSNMKYECQSLLEQIETDKETVKADFEELHQFLEVQEDFLLTRMEEVEKKIVQKRKENVDQLSVELCSLETIIWELQEKCQQPVNELLQVRHQGRGGQEFSHLTLGSIPWRKSGHQLPKFRECER
ncbi:E3 ubiquitin-protein ligase TRIM7-like [Candoia aspera]|uniref:E3 ubiquitin-protein ligase TRIM7-like n=1 Tax=Candoia aspera TaxID=51853 RepID=UPI002FD7E1FC